MHMTETETYKAKKQHRCDWCWQRIDVADEYKRYRFYNEGDVGTVKMHPECYEAMLSEAHYDGGYIEWTPGQERPVTANVSYAPPHASDSSENADG